MKPTGDSCKQLKKRENTYKKRLNENSFEANSLSFYFEDIQLDRKKLIQLDHYDQK